MQELEQEAIEFFCRIGRAYGLKDITMKIFAILYLEPEELAMEEIAKRTGYSLASVSNAAKILGNVGIVQRRKKPKTKKVFFYVEKNLVKLNIQKLRIAQESFVSSIKVSLPPIIEKFKKKVKDDKSKKKLKILENYYKQVKNFEIILEKWRIDLEKMSQEAEKRG
ncbi:hypothetical protein ISS05_01320 [Candidatus Woesearchaeota archaeon]|nr:hypothetical protein [Candidatus Woesearchaeota archaeon]